MSDVDIVKDRLDIVDYIGNKMELKSAGRNFKGKCPFHQESTPSFMVNPEMQIYKCFGCGEGGDIYEFIQKYEGVEFREALELAADHIGYELQDNYQQNDQLKEEKESLYKANKLAMEFWHFLLLKHNAGKPGREYMQGRGIRKQEAEKFQLGYAPQGTNLLQFLLKKGFDANKLETWGLIKKSKGRTYDKFRDRLILPIYNLKGQVIGFSGRVITPSDYAPKYLNSSETAVYKKSEILMGLYQAKDAARKEKKLILQEGNLDLLASHKVGIENIAATGGTAVTREQLKLVKRYGKTVLFCFDTDQAGLKALINAMEIAEEIGLDHQTIDLEQYQDPDDLIQDDPNLWEKKVNEAGNTLEYLFKVFEEDYDLGTADGKSKYAVKMVEILKKVKDKVQQQHFVEKLAVAVGVSQAVIQEQLARTTSSSQQILRPMKHSSDSAANSIQQNLNKTNESQRPSSDSPSKREIYFLSLLAATAHFSDFEEEANKQLLNDQINRDLLEVIKNHKSTGESYSKLSDDLSDQANERLQHVLTWDLTELVEQGEVEDELMRIYKLLHKSLLRRQILDLRAKLQDKPEDQNILSDLRDLSNQLNSFK